MKIITAVEPYSPPQFSERIFLAGGITGCEDWQKETISHLDEIFYSWNWDTSELAIFNPRRENFPIDDPFAAEEQIKWEFNALENCNIFSMYFCNSDSVQPICMYELGRNIVRMKEKYTQSYRARIVVSVEDGYKRAQDVIIQCRLAGIMALDGATPLTHAQAIAKAWCSLYGE